MTRRSVATELEERFSYRNLHSQIQVVRPTSIYFLPLFPRRPYAPYQFPPLQIQCFAAAPRIDSWKQILSKFRCGNYIHFTRLDYWYFVALVILDEGRTLDLSSRVTEEEAYRPVWIICCQTWWNFSSKRTNHKSWKSNYINKFMSFLVLC